jgi:diguanylate cyclase (GGDEF)-like protein/putative nucleotidyltransferase with HDIG domain
MRELPVRARVFWAVVCVAGVGSCLAAACYPFPKSTAPAWEYVLFTVLAALAGGRKIRLTRSKVESDEGSMSLGFALAFAAMLRCGPVGGLVANTAACFAGCLYPRRQKPIQFTFNVGLTAIESLLAGFVFLLLNGWTLKLSPAGSFLAIMSSCLTFFVVNTGGVATIIALCTSDSPLRVWRETFQWTATSYLTGACASALAMVLFAEHAATILLFVTPAAYFTYQFYGVQTERAAEKQEHIEQLQHSQEHLAELYLATIKSLALAIDAKDQYTHQHILRVQRYAVATAERLGITGSDLDGITTGALLHDIGKLGVPEYVLLKPGRLTEDEFAKIKKHPEIGAAILEPVDFPWPVLPVVKYHHEKWDGSGYPEGLKGEDIPLLARVLAVADVYDALTSTRSYRNAWTHEKTKEVILKDSGTHFDPTVAAAFLEIIDGIVEEMAANGEGPLAMKSNTARPVISTTDHAAREINRASSELWALYEVAQTLSSSLGLNETLEILARKLEAIMPGTGILFLLKGEEEGLLDVRAAVGVNVPFFLNAKTLGPHSRSLEVMTTGATFCGGFDADDLMPNSCEIAAWTPLDSAIIVPIIHQGERLGTINIYHPTSNAFSDHDVKLLELIAERAALALYNGLLYDRARSNALTDAVTGLRNVRFLTEHVQQKCVQAEQNTGLRIDDGSGDVRHDDRFALLCLDLDSFKPINDNFGHQKGDQVLVDLGRLFTSLVRPGDVVARYGGDEFLIVLNDSGPEEASRMADRIQHGVENYDPQLLHPKLGSLRLGVSVGYACFPHDGRECGALLSVADARMYTDKTERKLGNLKGRGTSADTGSQDLGRAA